MAEDIWHEVGPAEWLNAIARKYHIGDPDRIWNHANNADLKSRRDRNVLFPGDQVFIPAAAPKTDSCATGGRHSFEIKKVYDSFHVQLTHTDGTPMANERYRFAVDHMEKMGKLDGDGKLDIDQIIWPPGASGSLELLDMGLRYPIKIGALNPETKRESTDEPQYDNGLSGALMRLRNLGYYSGPVNVIPNYLDTAVPGDKILDAIIMFQVYEMDRDPEDADGTLDDETRNAIKTAFQI